MAGNSSDIFSTAIDREDREAFKDLVIRDFGDSANIEEVCLQWTIDYLVSDRNQQASSPFESKVLQRAALSADASSLIRRTQDPVIDGTSRLPGDMLIGIFGVGARCRIGQAAATAATTAPNLFAIQGVLDDSVLQLRQGALRRFECKGDEFMSYGSQVVGSVAGTIETDYAMKDRGWKKLKPVILGKDQQLLLTHTWNRLTDFGVAFSVTYLMPSLIGRVK